MISDRGLSNAVTEDWADELRDLEIAQVLDLMEHDHGANPHPQDGYVMIDGWPHVESTPQRLHAISRPAQLSAGALKKHFTKKERRSWQKVVDDLERFRTLIAERRQYAFELHGYTKGGNPRFKSPGHLGKMRCPGNPDSMHLPADHPLCEHPAGVPRSCRQQTVTVGEDVARKLRQDLYWGSDDWIASYNRRTEVERSFGILKSATGTGVRRGWTQQVGLVKTAFVLAVAVAAQNLARLLDWARRTGDTRDPLAGIDITDHGFVELDANGNLISDRAPPTS